MLVDAAQIAAAKRHAMAIEKLQDLDRNLAAVVHPIAKLRGSELSKGLGLAEVDDDPDHFRHRGAKKEVVQRRLVD